MAERSKAQALAEEIRELQDNIADDLAYAMSSAKTSQEAETVQMALRDIYLREREDIERRYHGSPDPVSIILGD